MIVTWAVISSGFFYSCYFLLHVCELRGVNSVSRETLRSLSRKPADKSRGDLTRALMFDVHLAVHRAHLLV